MQPADPSGRVSCAPANPTQRSAPRWARWVCAAALLGFGYWLFRNGAAHIEKADPDFEYFYKGGASLVERGVLDPGYDVIDGQPAPRGTLDWYLPAVPRLMSLFAWLPLRAAGYVWLALNLLALLAAVRLVGRSVSGLAPGDWPVTQLIPVLVLAAYWTWEFRLNQINNFTLLLLVGSFVCWERRERAAAGIWLGLATLLKLTPGLLIVWFLLKRDFRTVGAAVLTVLIAGPIADAVALRSPAAALDAYRGWARRAIADGSQRGLILHQAEVDWRNQGVGVVLCRWLHPTDYSTHFDNDPRVQAQVAAAGPEVPRTLNVAELSPRSVAGVVTMISVLSLAGLLWLTRDPARRLGVQRLRLEWALFMLAMLWFMPVMRRYHMIWTFPALAVLGGAIHQCGWRSGWTRIALAGIGATFLVQLALLSNEAGDLGATQLAYALRACEAGGVLLGSVLALAIPIVLRLIQMRRESGAAPVPAMRDSVGDVADVPCPLPSALHNNPPDSRPPDPVRVQHA